jgi:hypothetical protein
VFLDKRATAHLFGEALWLFSFLYLLEFHANDGGINGTPAAQ